ncbi:hypothetical protein PHLGIDRAFT_32542 [Phlebiopsis gigantea 11061_1 CR5-6]|uniref:Autophagy-related protein n=1 Tax=Phlebiopsis gigantea (strain 11061_1 CR5-6) TaxID=745531 RepID=A0A0C3NAD8_PHLG1|nr:hypothetical protein PHLGIDRAFT_32542 [Phlebiopsis gigantea 11061_1 CR5-6]
MTSSGGHTASHELEYDGKRYKQWLRGWLSYAFASEVFVVVSLTLFLPICLEQFARDNGYLLPDRTIPCTSVPSPTANSTTFHGATVNTPQEEVRCVVKLGWMWIDSASFSLYVNSISVALQALTVISMGNIADHRTSSTMLFLLLPSSSPIWPSSALLGICANVGFGASVVAMNAYLPTLARASEEVVKTRAELDFSGADHEDSTRTSQEHDGDASEPLLSSQHDTSPSDAAHEAYNTALSRATSRISSQGIALGYMAGILLLVIALVPVTLLHGTTFSLRLAIGLSGIWWAAFSLPAAAWLPSGSKTAEAEDGWGSEEGPDTKEKWSMGREILKAWKKLGNMLRWGEIKRLRNTFKFLAAWFLLSDGNPLAGIAGSLVWPIFQRRFAWSNLRIIVMLVSLASLLPAYGCLGFLRMFRGGHVKFGGLTTPAEMYVLAMYFGAVYGAFQGYARAFYSELIPHGEEARWYALYSITDKSSSFVGPLIVGIIADTTGNIRYAFFFLTFMVWSAVPILLHIDVDQGRRDATTYQSRA